MDVSSEFGKVVTRLTQYSEEKISQPQISILSGLKKFFFFNRPKRFHGFSKNKLTTVCQLHFNFSKNEWRSRRSGKWNSFSVTECQMWLPISRIYCIKGGPQTPVFLQSSIWEVATFY